MRIRRRNVCVWVSDDVLEWPGHRGEIFRKMDELQGLIRSLETGQTERLL